MSVLDILNREYPGDVAWWRFVDHFRPAWEERSDKSEQIARFGHEDIAIVLTTDLGDFASSWFEQNCKALGGRTPSDVLANERYGHAILRSLLMRMPR